MRVDSVENDYSIIMTAEHLTLNESICGVEETSPDEFTAMCPGDGARAGFEDGPLNQLACQEADESGEEISARWMVLVVSEFSKARLEAGNKVLSAMGEFRPGKQEAWLSGRI